MPISIHPDSHTDHSIPELVLGYVLTLFDDRDSFFVETVTYPESAESVNGPVDLPPVPCGIHYDVPESEVHYAKRGDRAYDSRLCNRPPRMVREVTIVAGPHPEDADAGMVLFTMYGGPAAPQEPGDPNLAPEKRADAEAFWSTSALSAEGA